MHTVGVLLQTDLLVIGPCSGTGRGVRSKNTNGLAEMERSQVPYVTLVFDTQNVHSRHTEHVLHQYPV